MPGSRLGPFESKKQPLPMFFHLHPRDSMPGSRLRPFEYIGRSDRFRHFSTVSQGLNAWELYPTQCGSDNSVLYHVLLGVLQWLMDIIEQIQMNM